MFVLADLGCNPRWADMGGYGVAMRHFVFLNQDLQDWDDALHRFVDTALKSV